jgi:uncharacterized C2H2 Zn-finger protein
VSRRLPIRRNWLDLRRCPRCGGVPKERVLHSSHTDNTCHILCNRGYAIAGHLEKEMRLTCRRLPVRERATAWPPCGSSPRPIRRDGHAHAGRRGHAPVQPHKRWSDVGTRSCGARLARVGGAGPAQRTGATVRRDSSVNKPGFVLENVTK